MDLIRRVFSSRVLFIIKLTFVASMIGDAVIGDPTDSTGVAYDDENGTPPNPQPTNPPPPSNPPLKDVICCIDTNNPDFKTVPVECTAIASYAQNYGVTSGSIATFRKAVNIPFIYIVDNYRYDEIYDRVKPDNVDAFIAELTKTIKDTNAHGLAFDYMNSDKSSGEVDNQYNEGVRNLFAGLKNKNPGLVIGLGLTKDQKVLNLAFNKEMIDPQVDFYLADTVYYNLCEHQNHQKDMANIAPVEAMVATIDMMIKLGYNSEKIVMIIRVVVQTTRKGVAGQDEDMSYSDMCSDKSVGKDRKFCTESLGNFYQKGKLVVDKRLKGVVIQSMDRDDLREQCKVGESFPVMDCITSGVFGFPEPKDITSNPNWALLPQDRG